MLGIERRTLYRWRTLNPTFIAELQRRQREMYESVVGKVLSTMLKSLAVIDRSLGDDENGTRTALKFASSMDMKRHVPVAEPLEIGELADEVIRRIRRQAGVAVEMPISVEEREVVLHRPPDRPARGDARSPASPMPKPIAAGDQG